MWKTNYENEQAFLAINEVQNHLTYRTLKINVNTLMRLMRHRDDEVGLGLRHFRRADVMAIKDGFKYQIAATDWR